MYLCTPQPAYCHGHSTAPSSVKAFLLRWLAACLTSSQRKCSQKGFPAQEKKRTLGKLNHFVQNTTQECRCRAARSRARAQHRAIRATSLEDVQHQSFMIGASTRWRRTVTTTTRCRRERRVRSRARARTFAPRLSTEALQAPLLPRGLYPCNNTLCDALLEAHR